MSAGAGAYAPPAARLRVTAGGIPTGAQAAALAAALAALVESEAAAPADPRPAVYRSRWRRAALEEACAPGDGRRAAHAWGGAG